MAEAMIFDAIRTPRGRARADGGLHDVKPVALLAGLLRDLRQRNGFDSAVVDDVLVGCATPVAEQGGCIARTAALAAGWDSAVAGVQLGRLAASGLDAVNLAAQRLGSGWESLLVAGGVESLSRVPPGSDGAAWAIDPDTSLNSNFVPPGIAADLVATLDGLARAELDDYALAAQQRAAAAAARGTPAGSRVPVIDVVGMPVLTEDELGKPHLSAHALAALRPAFQHAGELGFDAVALRKLPGLKAIRHVHTAGNCAPLADGAALVLLGSPGQGAALGLTPRARVVAGAVAGSDPAVMLGGGVVAARKALERAGLRADQIDLFEVNEAYAAVVLHFMRALAVPHARVNVDGGAIALGHAGGATGAMLVGSLVAALAERGLRYGLISVAAGAGLGCATIIERV